MKTSCVQTPANSHFIELYEWQIAFCKGNHCAALLLSFFIKWHNWKLQNDQYCFHLNDHTHAYGDTDDDSAYAENAFDEKESDDHTEQNFELQTERK